MHSIKIPAMNGAEISNKVTKLVVVGGRLVGRPETWDDLGPIERYFVCAMKDLRTGGYKDLHIVKRQLSLKPWPQEFRVINLGTKDPRGEITLGITTQLTPQLAEFFEHVRSVDSGVIQSLEVVEGQPTRMTLYNEVSSFGGQFNG